MRTEDLTGRLLVATPGLGEGVFERCVMLVLHHGDEGAQAVVLNKPVDATIDTVLDGWQEHVREPQVLFQGGPVQLDSALGVVGVVDPALDIDGVQQLFPGVGVVDLDTPADQVMPHLTGVRIFAGYAGWVAGQLEGEIRNGSWYVVDRLPGDVFSDEPGTLWRRVLRRQPGRLAFVGLYPDDEDYN